MRKKFALRINRIIYSIIYNHIHQQHTDILNRSVYPIKYNSIPYQLTSESDKKYSTHSFGEKKWCFRPQFYTVRLNWTGDNLG